MSKQTTKPLILSIDDDADIRRLIEQILVNSGYEVITAESGKKALQLINTLKPELILLDVMMPEMNGYDLCARLQENKETAYIPVIFLTALEKEQDKARAFAVGGVDYIAKPIQRKILLDKIQTHLTAKGKWKEFEKKAPPEDALLTPADFLRFKQYLFEELKLSEAMKTKLLNADPSIIYSVLSKEGIRSSQVAKFMAKFFKINYMPVIDPESVKLGVFPVPFSRNNQVIPLGNSEKVLSFVLSNPFNWNLLEALKKYVKSDQISFFVTEPENIESILEYGSTATDKKISALEEKIKITPQNVKKTDKGLEEEIEKKPVVHITNTILYTAVTERASDIHIEPKENHTLIRFRIDGDMRDMFSFNNATGVMVITRLKALAGLDITERRKPQDGAVEATIDNRKFKLRLATTSTPNGESIIMRLLEPSVKTKDLSELGMTGDQASMLTDLANRIQGLILIVGPTGSGKTTTIYSLLAQIDCQKRSLISVEDPVEYRIHSANQQQVNEKMGVTFEALLRSSVRQDPDILFIGEVRDQYSARVAIDFASTGHITITTLHTSNATTAIFRLERLGVSRGQMADTILCIVAQRLLKRLCPHCKEIVPISQAEIDMLAPYLDEMPAVVAHPVGCPRCNESGYMGREGIQEIIKFDTEISDMVRAEKSIAEIRAYITQRGDYLISHHAAEKVKGLIFSPQDIYAKVLVEEPTPLAQQPEIAEIIQDVTTPIEAQQIIAQADVPQKTEPDSTVTSQVAVESGKNTGYSILIVEDDKDTQLLMSHFLVSDGYDISIADDGIDALIKLAQRNFDLIISDIQMPNLDGFKFLEIKNQKGITTPVIFLTSYVNEEDEVKGFELGAIDFIRKPIRKDILMLRIKRTLQNQCL
jgi:type IV pilus assembly protein PilB